MIEAGEMGERGEPDDDEYQELLYILRKEEENALGYEGDQIYDDQIKAFERYVGLDYGDEQPGRSSVHDRSVFEIIEWIRPDLARVFTSGGNSVIVEPWAPGTDAAAQDATDYLNHVFFEDLEGEEIIDSFSFDGLLQKRGVGAVYWQPAELGDPVQAGLTQEELQGLQMGDVEILEVTPNESGTFMVQYQPVRRKARPYPVVIAPEDFRISARSVSLDRPRYCGHRERLMKSDLIAEFPDKEDKIREYAEEEGITDIDGRRAARFWDEDQMYNLGVEGDDLTAEVVLWREYIYHDLNEDGYAELIEVFRIHDCILSAEPVDDNPYFSWTPIPIPHRWFGLSIYDIAQDIQKIKTALLRGALDSVYLSVAPRQIANANVNLSDLLTVRPGAIIRTESTNPVGQDVMPLVTPDLSGSAINMFEVVDQMGERRTGVSRNAQGLDPDTLNKTASGIKMMQTAAASRKEQIARNLARGVEMMFRKIYRLCIHNTKGKQSVHMGKGQFREFDPSSWAPEAKIRIHVGNGTGDRETQLNQQMMMLGLQREWVANFGPGNPIVGIKELHNMVEDIGRTIGMRTVDQYFKDPETVDPQALQQLLQPKPDPKAEEAKAKLQIDQQKMQSDQQMAAQKMQTEAQMEQTRLQQSAASDQAKLQMQAQSDQQKLMMQREQMMLDHELKREQLYEELRLKREQLAEELVLKREMMQEELALKRQMATAAGSATGGGTSRVAVGGEPG